MDGRRYPSMFKPALIWVHNSSVWANTVLIASSCNSGGKPYFLRMRFTITLILGGTFADGPVDGHALTDS